LQPPGRQIGGCMQRYLLRRIAQVPIMLLLVSVAAFAAMQLVPGGPLAIYARGNVSPEALEAIRQKLGLDDPVYLQYLHWLVPAVQGDLGYSFASQRPVLDEVLPRIGPTFYLMSTTFIVVLVSSILLGTLQAIRQYSRVDIFLTTLSFGGAAMPVFWLGLVLILADSAIRNPATGRPFLPISGMATPGLPSSLGDLASHLVLPMLTLAFGWVSWYARYVRASMLDVIHQDYIRTARAKGLSERLVIFKHAFRNASLPLVTVVALDLPYLFAGALFTEIIFGWPGMGLFFYQSVVKRDYPVMMTVIIVIGILVQVGNLIADIAYTYLDPRIRYSRRSGT
jgi:peptide/nickel transport system permease protein